MTQRPGLEGIHHVKFAVSDRDRSLAFYARALGARRVAAWDHKHADGTRYAATLEVPGLGTHLELRPDPEQAARQRGFDPITVAVRGRSALEERTSYLNAAGIEHSPRLPAIQALLEVFADPDERRSRLYTRETHGPEISANDDPPWIAR